MATCLASITGARFGSGNAADRAGIYGKPAAEALTPDNQTAELYDPAVFRRKPKNRMLSWWKRLWRRLCAFFRAH